MRIAIHTGRIDESTAGSRWHLLSYWVAEMAKQYPQHQWLVIGNKSLAETAKWNNLDEVLIEIPEKPGPIKGWWYGKKAMKATVKWKADVLLNLDLQFTFNSSLPTITILHPDFVSGTEGWFGKRRISGKKKKLLLASAAVGVAGEEQQHWLATQYSLPSQKVFVMPPATLPAFHPISWTIKEEVKREYANGKEYFLFYALINKTDTVLKLLKAFSAFKKRQRSNLQLLIADANPSLNVSLLQKLESYKYRDDVQLRFNLSMQQLSQLAGAAYAVILPPQFSPAWWMLGTMESETALVSETVPNGVSLGADAAWMLENFAADHLAQALKQLYTNENQRSNFIQAAAALAKKYSWPQTAQACMSAIDLAVGVK